MFESSKWQIPQHITLPINFIKTQSTYSNTETIFQGGSPCATEIFKSRFALVGWYFFLRWFLINPYIPFFGIAIVIYVYSFLLESSKCKFPQSIKSLIKTTKRRKTNTQTIIQACSPWATRIFNSNSRFALVGRYCVLLFLWVDFCFYKSMASCPLP